MDRLADEWWSLSGPYGLLQSFNDYRVPFVCSQLEKLGKIRNSKEKNALEGLTILDVGCGAGIYAEGLAKRGAKVVGLEPVQKLVEVAKNHLEKNSEEISGKVEYICGTVEEHCRENRGKYDVVVCSEVLEHVQDKISLVRGCVEALKFDGDIFFTTPNRTVASVVINWLFGEIILGVLPRGGHNPNWFIHHDTLDEILNGLRVKRVRIEGFTYFPIFDVWKAMPFRGLSYVYHGVKGN